MHLALYQNRNLPTDSAEEAYISPSRDLVIAFFGAFDEHGKGHEMTRIARQLAKSGLFDE